MKTIKFLFSLLFLLGMMQQLGAQNTPQKFNYQAVARNAAGAVLANQAIGLKISLLDGSAAGTVQYAETHNVTTNAFGLFNIAIGSGTVSSGSMAGVTWSAGNKFIKSEFDPAGGTAYTLAGTSELLSVPYAMYAQASATGGTGTTYTGGAGINITGAGVISATDNSATNELQTISLTGNQLTLSNTGGTVTLPTGTTYTAGTGISLAGNAIANTGDLSATNELQALSITGNQLTLSNTGGTVTLPTGTTYTAGTGISLAGNAIANTGDLSATNELQALSITGNQLTLSNTGGTVTLPTGTTYTAGNGISLAGNAIANTGDLSTTNELQTISLTGNQLTLSNTGGTVTLPTGTTYTAGTGINIAGGVISASGAGLTLPYAGTTATLPASSLTAFSVTETTTAFASNAVAIKGVSSLGIGVYGQGTAGVYGQSTSGNGVRGVATTGVGVDGSSTSFYGVSGVSSSSYGVFGSSTSNTAAGVYGINTSGGEGVQGTGTSGTGVNGRSTSSTGVYGGSTSGFGVFGQSQSNNGVYGSSTSNNGVRGLTTSSTLAAVLGANTSGGSGVEGSATSGNGVRGVATTGIGVDGSSTSNDGVRGGSTSGIGVRGVSSSGYGVRGVTSSSTLAGVYGLNTSGGNGVEGIATTGIGVFGQSTSSNAGYFTSSTGIGVNAVTTTGTGVFGGSNSGFAVHGISGSSNGVRGISTSADGTWGETSSNTLAGVFGNNNAGGRGVEGYSAAGNGVFGRTGGTAAAGAYGVYSSGDAFKTMGGSMWIIPSDVQLKNNIRPFEDGLGVLMQIKPKKYFYNGLAGTRSDDEVVGIIAQEMQKIAPYTVAPSMVDLHPEANNGRGSGVKSEILTYNANALIYITVNAIQEQQTQIENLKKQNADLLKRLEKIERK